MATASLPLSGRPATADTTGAKGLRTGTLGLGSSIVIGVASTAPRTRWPRPLGFIVVLVGVQSPITCCSAASYTSWALPFSPHSQVGGVWLLGIGTMAVGLLWLPYLRLRQPAFFRGETLNADTATLVPDVPVLPVGTVDSPATVGEAGRPLSDRYATPARCGVRRRRRPPGGGRAGRPRRQPWSPARRRRPD